MARKLSWRVRIAVEAVPHPGQVKTTHTVSDGDWPDHNAMLAQTVHVPVLASPGPVHEQMAEALEAAAKSLRQLGSDGRTPGAR